MAVLLALVLVPNLCIAGVIHDDCDCHEQACSHEVDCDTDPCLQLSHATNNWRSTQLIDGGLDCLLAGIDSIPALELRRSLVTPGKQAPPTPVIHDSDFPLLL